jgi:hypothetical protein
MALPGAGLWRLGACPGLLDKEIGTPGMNFSVRIARFPLEWCFARSSCTIITLYHPSDQGCLSASLFSAQ